MLFLEAYARPLLVVHGVSAAVLVGAATHHLLWCRHYRRGTFARVKAERTFALVSACAFTLTFVLGNLLYPTYKVRVRAQFLDSAEAVGEEVRLRAAHALPLATAPADPPRIGRALGGVAHLFDIKEHWVAIGCAASLLLLALSRFAHPKDHPQVVALYLGLSAIQCGTAWLGAIIGLTTASFRAVGGLT